MQVEPGAKGTSFLQVQGEETQQARVVAHHHLTIPSPRQSPHCCHAQQPGAAQPALLMACGVGTVPRRCCLLLLLLQVEQYHQKAHCTKSHPLETDSALSSHGPALASVDGSGHDCRTGSRDHLGSVGAADQCGPCVTRCRPKSLLPRACLVLQPHFTSGKALHSDIRSLPQARDTQSIVIWYCWLQNRQQHADILFHTTFKHCLNRWARQGYVVFAYDNHKNFRVQQIAVHL